MTADELFNKYYYLVERHAAAYGLDEDDTQNLAIYFWRCTSRYADYPKSPAAYFGMRVATKARYYAEHSKPLSVEKPDCSDVSYCVLCPGTVELRWILAQLERITTVRNYDWFVLYYLQEYTFDEIGAMYGRTSSCVSQAVRKTMRRLRTRLWRSGYWDELQGSLHSLINSAYVAGGYAYI